MTAFHVSQSLRDSRVLRLGALAALLAASSACGKITAAQPPDAAPTPPDAGAPPPDALPDIVDAMPLPPDANLGPLLTLKHVNAMTVQLVDCLACVDQSGDSHAENSWFLVLDLAAAGVVGDFQVANVQVGVRESRGANGTQPAEINLYTIPTGAELLRSNFTFIANRLQAVPDQLALEVTDMPISARIPAGSTLVVELFVPDGELTGDLFLMGCNGLGSAGKSFVQGRTCQEIANITEFGELGAADRHLVMAVQGYDLGALQD